MYCFNCGAKLPDKANFCGTCGVGQEMVLQDPPPVTPPPVNNSLIGFSDKINDPRFAQYLKNTKRWTMIFSCGLAVIAVIGFTIAGAMGVEGLENPQAFFQGLVIGGMFLLIGLFTVFARKRSRSWDGVVVDKTVKEKRRKQSTGSDKNDFYWVDYLEYAVLIRADSGKTYRITAEDDDTRYNYYKIGDRVRHHGGLNSYEKYDKSGDSIIFCNACATLCDINDDTCFRCGCPLLK